MADTLTTSLQLIQQVTGENEDTWGDNVDTNWDRIEQAIVSTTSKAVTGAADVTLTAAEQRSARLEFTGTLTANQNIIVADAEKLWFVKNGTSGAYTLTVKTSGGSGVAVTQGGNAILYCDGTDVIEFSITASSLPVSDNTSIVQDPVDNTKAMRIDVGAVSTSTVRVLTMGDRDVDLASGGTFAELSHTHTVSNITDAGALAPLDTVGTTEIDDDAVTYAKIQNAVSNNVILGNNAGAGGVVAELTATNVRTIINVEDGADVTDETNVTAAFPISDATSLVYDPVDNTKLIRIDAGAITTGTTRVITMGDRDVDLASGGTFAENSHSHALTDLASQAAYSFVANATGSSAAPTAVKVSALTEELAPATGDWLLLEDAAGTILKVDWANLPGASGGISDVVDDTTPQLGGMLDVNGNAIGDGTLELLTFTEDASAVNHVNIENEATGGGPIISAAGDDTNIDLILAGKGSGVPKIGSNAILDAGDIGSTVQAEDAGLTSIAGLTTAADRMIYTTASDTYAVATLTSAGRALLDDADASAQRTTLGLVIDTDVQSYNSVLDTPVGQHTVDLLAYGLISRTTNGATQYSTEKATNDIMVAGYEYSAGTEQAIQIMFPMPKGWNEGTVIFKFYWTTSDTAGTGNVIWGVKGGALSNDDAIDTALGTAQEVTDGFLADGDMHITSETSAVTLAGSPAAEDMAVFEIYRKAADASDTYTQTAVLVAAMMHYTTDAMTDD